MWICAKCGTQAKQMEVCSGCGCLMRLPSVDPPPARAYEFVLIVHLEDGTSAAYGPFDSIMTADEWQDAHFKRITCQVVLMENPKSPNLIFPT